MRPWIVDLVLSARNHLTEALKTLNPDADPLEAYSSAEVPGVGLCLIAHRDLVKGVKAYTVFLQRYALHVRNIIFTCAE